MKSVTGLILLISIVACAGIGIPNSSDPYKKLEYSHQATKMKRYIPAERLIVEAIEIFKERNDKAGLADAYSEYGNFHKYGYFDQKPLTRKPNPEESVKYFKLAQELFEELGDRNGVAKTYMGMGSAILDTDKKQGCEYYLKAKESYNPSGKKFWINPSFKDFPEMVQYFYDQECKEKISAN